MSMTLVKAYFAARCRAVGLSEHTDGFNEENIAASNIDNSFHILLGSFSGRKLNQSDQEIDCPVIVSFWVKGFADPAEGIDRAVQLGETLLKETLKNSNRLGQCLKNVTFSSMSVEPLSTDNDNAIKVSMSFTAFTSLLIS
jgi:hypothetical protein